MTPEQKRKHNESHKLRQDIKRDKAMKKVRKKENRVRKGYGSWAKLLSRPPIGERPCWDMIGVELPKRSMKIVGSST
jgi:hypothetical protein